MEDIKYEYFLSVPNKCEHCGYDHKEHKTQPIFICTEYAAGVFCRECQEPMKFTFIQPSMLDFWKDNDDEM